MKSEKPKALQPLLEEPMVYYPLRALQEAGLKDIAVLVGHRGEMVEDYLKRDWPDVEVVWQKEQLGTGHALMVSVDWWQKYEHLLVLSADVPLVQSETIVELIETHFRHEPQCSLMSVNLDDPEGYGRIVRLADGGVRIVEHTEAVEDELMIHEINAGVYLFCTSALHGVLDDLSSNDDSGEYYLTDAIPLIGESEGAVHVVVCEDEFELLGVNTPSDLAATGNALKRRIVSAHMKNGLKCMDPISTWIGPRVELDSDVFIEPGVQIWGKTFIGRESRIGSHSTLRNVVVGRDSIVHGPSVLSDSTIGDSAQIGPFAVLRNETTLADRAKVGRFVEVKNSDLREDAKVPHLSYVGDAVIGERTNIGASSVTCNYDGRKKHKTVIGKDCFVGSDTMFIAPVTLGDNSSTAAGSVITRDVPDGAMAVARSRQTNIENWHSRKNVAAGGKASEREEK